MQVAAKNDQHPAPIRKVGVLSHPKVAATQPVAREIQGWLQAQGLETWGESSWDENTAKPQITDTDLIIVLGGDGSLLRAARMSYGCEALLVGVNMGRLGFLSEMAPETWPQKLAQVLAGDYWVEERMMLTCQTWRDGQLFAESVALNDVVISRGSLARVVRLATEIDGDPLTTYVADGLIVSTPTGSTAYALAAGGPILPPELRSILVVPIAPHLTLSRSIVLAEGATVTVRLSTDHQSILTVDGQFEIELDNGDQITIKAGEHVSRLARVGPRTYFYHSLLKRLVPREES